MLATIGEGGVIFGTELWMGIISGSPRSLISDAQLRARARDPSQLRNCDVDLDQGWVGASASVAILRKPLQTMMCVNIACPPCGDVGCGKQRSDGNELQDDRGAAGPGRAG
jgi:hypothetical protein